ncbi:MAG: caspase family protein, partial [Bacteroidia bacterium]
LFISLHAQQVKGVSMLAAPPKNTNGKTYAVIVGISNYKNMEIPRLQFAGKDAVAFRDYLLVIGVDSANINLLVNENASYMNIILDLDEICTNKVKEGDKVYFYFSGHGDVESRVITNDGYLLPFDAPSKVYAISALKIQTLQSYISTLSSKGVRAFVITDACHSGNLAGGAEGLTNLSNVLKGSWKDEIKILSCQPGEISLEGKQWGNGRGLFSFELINGLAGNADKNKDGKVTLGELNIYLSEKVSEQASPVPQYPVVAGNMQTVISTVNKTYANKIQAPGTTAEISPVELKGTVEGLLKGLPDSIILNYRLYKKYLDEGKLYNGENVPSAFYYYEKIEEKENTGLLKSIMKRNLEAEAFAGIRNFSNGVINNQWDSIQNKTGSAFVLQHFFDRGKLISLGIYSSLVFEELYNRLTFYSVNESFKSLLDSALSIDPNSALLRLMKGLSLQGVNDSLAIVEFQKAIAISPKFLTPYWNISASYSGMKKYHEANAILLQSLVLDSSYEFVCYSMIMANYAEANETDAAKTYLLRADAFVAKHPETINSPTHFSMAFPFLMQGLVALKEYNKAFVYLDKIKLGGEKNEKYYEAVYMTGLIYFEKKEYRKAVEEFQQCVQSGVQTRFDCNYDLARCYSMMKDKKNSLKYLELAIEKGMNEPEQISRDINLDFIRPSVEYKVLMQKYFPDQIKK